MPPKYDFRVNPVYHVDVQNLATGKLLSATKRRVQFKFGFSNKEAIAQGLTGVEARGEEHEVTLVWSLVSGKRYVHADGQEVHYSRGNRTDPSFETSWVMNGGHTIKVIAHAFPPLNYVPGFHQFDLQLDGCSIYDMPKIYELGTDRSTRLVKTSLRQSLAFALPPEETLKHAKNSGENSSPRQSARDSSPSPPGEKQDANSEPQSEKLNQPKVDLLDSSNDMLDQAPSLDSNQSNQLDVLYNPSPAHLAPSPNVMPNPVYDYSAQTASTPVLALPNESHTHGVPLHPSCAYQPYITSTPAPTYSYAPYSQPVDDQWKQQYADKAGFDSKSYNLNQSLSEADTKQFVPNDTVASRDDSPELQASFSSVRLTMNPLSLADFDAAEQEHQAKSELDRALTTLVNIDDITELKESPEHVKRSLRQKEGPKTRSEPLPARTGYMGSQATLADIRTRVGPKAAPSKEVMRTHSFHPAAAQAGMMVVFGAPSVGSSSRIPPMTGFGAGAMTMTLPHTHYRALPYGQQQQTYTAY